MSESEYVKFENAEVVAESTLGLKVSIDGGEAFWVPKTAIHDDSEVYTTGTTGTLILAKWLADKEELEGEEYEP